MRGGGGCGGVWNRGKIFQEAFHLGIDLVRGSLPTGEEGPDEEMYGQEQAKKKTKLFRCFTEILMIILFSFLVHTCISLSVRLLLLGLLLLNAKSTSLSFEYLHPLIRPVSSAGLAL